MNNYKTNRLQSTSHKNPKIDKSVSVEDLDPKVLEVLKKNPGAFIIGKK